VRVFKVRFFFIVGDTLAAVAFAQVVNTRAYCSEKDESAE
tara:strand:+ start:6488 stop:6607 length:120 start_codon:yes stop_codon:yes gene_type:complete